MEFAHVASGRGKVAGLDLEEEKYLLP